jgi:RimJ/RimL family protein N-acetyltransferase
MTVYLETDRLVLRRLTTDDVDAVHALHSDSTVMRYLSTTCPTRDQVRDEVLPGYLDWHRRSETWGYWATIERGTGTFLGWHMFRPVIYREPAPGEIEVGWRLNTAAWGHGFATEGASALLDNGFRNLGVQSVLAMTMTVNERSWQVMRRLGMRHVQTFHVDYQDKVPGFEQGEVEYAVTRHQWLTRSSVPRGFAG